MTITCCRWNIRAEIKACSQQMNWYWTAFVFIVLIHVQMLVFHCSLVVVHTRFLCAFYNKWNELNEQVDPFYTARCWSCASADARSWLAAVCALVRKLQFANSNSRIGVRIQFVRCEHSLRRTWFRLASAELRVWQTEPHSSRYVAQRQRTTSSSSSTTVHQRSPDISWLLSIH